MYCIIFVKIVSTFNYRLTQHCPSFAQIQAKYPRVVELVARKIETLRVDQPSVKVLPWEKVRQIVKEEVNPLLSERQLGYVFKCLANAGVVSLGCF